MGALARRSGRHRAGLAGAALVAALLAAAPAAAPQPAHAHAAAGKERVRYSATGGIAGIAVSLRVFADRTARASDGGQVTSFRLDDGEWRQLQRRLRAARFATLERRYGPEQPVADGITEQVRHAGRSVTVETGGNPPRRLARLVELLARVHRAHAPSR